jgi:prepilin-type N-terminal cleavage/methylation domain-containing protein
MTESTTGAETLSSTQRTVDRAARVGARGFTFIESIVVVAIIGLMVAVGLPNFQRARVRAEMYSRIKIVRQGVAIARITAIRRGRQVVVAISGTGRGVHLVAGIDQNADEDLAGEEIFGDWPFEGKDISVADDASDPLRTVKIDGVATSGLVIRPDGIVWADAASDGTGTGALLLSDPADNEIKVTILSGTGIVGEEMKIPDTADSWSKDLKYWRY